MDEVTLDLPEEWVLAIRRIAEQSGRSENDVMLDYIQQEVARCEMEPPQADVFRSSGVNLSEHVDELLDGYGEHELTANEGKS